MKLMVGPKGRHWIAMPAVKRLNEDGTPRLSPQGKAVWDPITEFRDRVTAARFGDMVLAALQAAHPEAFA
jgi:hypothetical protein